ncbi:ABC transporter ATP-binding protein [Ileibacterium valens]|uniref:ABC transporter ATP-binding protein n=1 Tax=Ileibacterium valens TaxID=1862668 RepID=UPI0009FB5EFB|nr:ABC transporter ATP-binding protein [Ileibacterium valens]
MIPALSVRGLNKSFGTFALKGITFEVPQGTVCAIIGENGSGKSSTLECILGIDIPDSGNISIYGINPQENIDAHSLVGVAFDSCPFPENCTAADLQTILKGVFKNWNSTLYSALIEECKIPLHQKIRTFSRGMKAKLDIVCALCHEADLLILDEATAGLDPVIREEMIDQLLNFMQDEKHAILMTSHISSDLERIADYIIFIKDGQIVFIEQKDLLLAEYGMACVSSDQLEYIAGEFIVRLRKQAMNTDLLIRNRAEFSKRYPDYSLRPASLDEIVLMFTRGKTL